MSVPWLALMIFVTAYTLFVIFPHHRMWAALAGAALLVITGVLSPGQAFAAVNWNVMGIFVGTLVVAEIFMESRVPAYVAEVIVDRARDTRWAILLMCLLTSFISIFVENVATVLIVAPIAMALARKLDLNPVKMMIALAVSSNLQGTATLIGDPPSMLLGGFAKMSFMDFFFYQGRPSIFFAVELGGLASMAVLYVVFRPLRDKTALVPVEKVKSWVPTAILVVLIAALAMSSAMDAGFSYLAGVICMIAALITMAWDTVVNRTSILRRVKALDWNTTLFLVGVFVLVGSLTLTGWITVIADHLSALVGGNIFFGYTVMVLISVAVSAFVDNVPFLAAMMPVAMAMAAKLQIPPSLFLFGLLIGASLGGNITPIGASANIVACGLLKKEGYAVGFKEFAKIGVPFTLAAVGAGYLFIWLVWGAGMAGNH